jgi:OOP family OmpA-OmpF porin
MHTLPVRHRRAVLARTALPLAAVAALAVLPAAARAADESVGKFYVTPSIYGTWPSGTKQVDNDKSYGVAIGRHFTDDWSAELGYLHGTFDGAPGTGNLRLNAYSIDALRHFYRGSAIHPYLLAGLASIDGKRAVPSLDGTGTMFEAGLGVMGNLWTSTSRTFVFGLRGELKNRWMLAPGHGNESKQSDFLAGLGLQFQFGPARAVAAAAPLAAAAAEAAPAPAPAPVDSDGDGVTDDHDRCPNTPAGAKVDANGCELDSDGDGVVDRLDRCPGTPPGIKVDVNGCEIEEIVLRGVNFDTNKSTLRPESKTVLDSVVALLKQRPGAKVEIDGHTDSVGKDAYNQKLSERRAKTVVEYLVANGIPAGDLTAKGYGETRPIASNDTAEGREQNRRVTLQFTEYARK